MLAAAQKPLRSDFISQNFRRLSLLDLSSPPSPSIKCSIGFSGSDQRTKFPQSRGKSQNQKMSRCVIGVYAFDLFTFLWCRRVLSLQIWSTKLKLYIFFFYSQIDQNAREDFNVTSDVEFNAIRSLVLGRVHSKWGGRSDPDDAFEAAEHSDTDSFQKILCRTRQWGTGKCCLED